MFDTHKWNLLFHQSTCTWNKSRLEMVARGEVQKPKVRSRVEVQGVGESKKQVLKKLHIKLTSLT